MKRIAFSIIVVVAFGSYFSFAEVPRSPEQYAQDLGSPIFAVRDTATKELWKLGETARAALEEAAKSDDLEVAERASEILTKFNWGIYSDTPADVLKQIREFRSGEVAQQTAAIVELLSLGGPGIETLSKILAHDFPNENRDAIFATLKYRSRQRVPVLIVQGQFERAEKILELGLHGPLPHHGSITRRSCRCATEGKWPSRSWKRCGKSKGCAVDLRRRRWRWHNTLVVAASRRFACSIRCPPMPTFR